MKVFITGIAGMIGYHTAKKLIEDGHEVWGIDDHNDYYDPQLKQDREDINFTTGWRKQCKLIDLLEAGLVSENMVQNIENGQILYLQIEN